VVVKKYIVRGAQAQPSGPIVCHKKFMGENHLTMGYADNFDNKL
jgi:hypothetical protein